MKFSNNYETFASAKAFKDYTEATRSTQGSDPTEWDGTNNKCKEPFCGVELDMNDFDDICNNCFNQVEPEEQEKCQVKEEQEKCEICNKDIEKEEYDFCDICDDCRE
jgi:hypothetical protein